ncbi:DUF4192 domain-containing protein [Streptomyces gamaensis]|uniref:DUF4192 domain-containing protein n=1 Tax=Streptomyces gamaensis TaxID=1763542 RepID=A0ABW0Z4L1_9ACTN
MTKPDEPARPSVPSTAAEEAEQQVTLRSPAELADALPYLLGFHPDDSIVMVALHGGRGRFGGRLRLGIPPARQDWPAICEQLAETLLTGSDRRGARPDGVVVYLCQDPAPGQPAREVMRRLRPLAQRLRQECGRLGMPVFEALCISDGRFWSYCCPDTRCCPPDGTPVGLPGTSVMAAAAAYAGIEVRGTLRQMQARFEPVTGARADEQRRALDAAAAELVPRILCDGDSEAVRRRTLDLARAVVDRLHGTPPLADRSASDARDDGLLTATEAAGILLGLQDRVTRDRAAEWMEGERAQAVLRTWRALARRCVPPFGEYAAAPVTLAGWVAWSTGDHPEARVALGHALTVDPGYLFAQLLHRACNQGLDPEPLRSCLREEQAGRALHEAAHAEAERAATADRARKPDRPRPGGRPGTRPRSARPGGPASPSGALRTRDGGDRRAARSRQDRRP